MASVVNTAAIKAFLQDGLFKVNLEMKSYPAQFKEIYVTKKSERQTEFVQEAYGYGPAEEQPEGSPASLGQTGQSFAYSFTHKFYAILGVFTEQAIRFNRYREFFPQIGKSLRSSLLDRKNTNAMYLFNNAFDGNVVYGDGQPLCSLVHPNVNGAVYANTLTVLADPSESSFNDIKTLVAKNIAPGGTRDMMKPKQLLNPIELENQIVVLLGSEGRVGTANREINPIKETNYAPKGYMSSVFLSSSLNWFVLTDHEDSFYHFVAKEPTPNVDTDSQSNNVTFMMSEGYSFGPASPRGVYGVRGLGIY